MEQAAAIDMIRGALWFTLAISAPALTLSVIVGLTISVFQTVTQIHEQTLTFVPKILALIAAAVFFGPWMLQLFQDYIWKLWGGLHEIAPH